jgi:hypothetical protein
MDSLRLPDQRRGQEGLKEGPLVVVVVVVVMAVVASG